MVTLTLPCSPASLAAWSIRRLSAWKSCSSCLALAAASAALFALELLSDVSGRIDGSGGSTEDRLVSSWLEPELSIDLPPSRIAPENASWRDFCSSSNFDVFTDEIEN